MIQLVRAVCLVEVLAEWDTKEELEKSLTQTQGKLNQVIHNHIQKQHTTAYRAVTNTQSKQQLFFGQAAAGR